MNVFGFTAFESAVKAMERFWRTLEESNRPWRLKRARKRIPRYLAKGGIRR